MNKFIYKLAILFCFFGLSVLSAQVDPETAPKASIDRFSPEAGHLFIRDDMNGLPGPNQPIDFDKGPFITKGLGPKGELVSYYNFDVQPTESAPIYVLFKEGESTPVVGQLNIVNVIPGDSGYNDFWDVTKVTVPQNYVANTVTSLAEIESAGYQMEETAMLVNCPIVPDESTAKLRLNGESPELTQGWYKGEIVYYFNFTEKALTAVNDMVPVSPIYVTFNINPDQPGGGPPSGFVTEWATGRAHNVIATLPQDDGYSPLWSVNVYDNKDFEKVHDLTSALSANILAVGVANVNCPMVASYVKVDRFSAQAAHLFIRDETNGLPGPNQPIDFDQGEPFITKGLGPKGEFVSYYNFDVQSTVSAPIFVLFREGESMPVKDQMNIIDVIPGDSGYNDFWDVTKVTVPKDYIPNTVTSYQQIVDAGYSMEETPMLVNCPVVPEGSTAKLRLNGESPELTEGWYKGEIVYYFNFTEKTLTAENDMVPISPIYVTFKINPDKPGGGPPSGFVSEPGTGRVHNVVTTLPQDEGYSPLWSVNVYDNADFDKVHDLGSVLSTNILAIGVANVNCPIVEISNMTDAESDNTLPSKYELSQNYPNPFNPTTEIKFSLASNQNVSLKIYNSIGQLVTELVNKSLSAGNYTVQWNAGRFASGIYYYSLDAENFHSVKKMVLLK